MQIQEFYFENIGPTVDFTVMYSGPVPIYEWDNEMYFSGGL